ncbi:quinon protein alcohol dehydrogenase-like superfamily [Umbelopsis sp. AD052]|nr:quinon protein alcohol dehydrogenase-like superfamily [Umbelopsis sp. AD052]
MSELEEEKSYEVMAHNSVSGFLTRHVPKQLTSPRQTCYRHRTDIARTLVPEESSRVAVQKQLENLPKADQNAIAHIWSMFSAAPANQRLLMLQGIVSTCCMPQLSFLASAVEPLLKIDFLAVLPHEVSLKILSHLDAKSLCHAAQVSRTWKHLADDDIVWHRMCEQHIDKKCTKCGWGLPLLYNKKALRKRQRSSDGVTAACGTKSVESSTGAPQDQPSKRRRVSQDTDIKSAATPPPDANRRPWKDVYSERLIVERNWRANKYTVRTLKGHKDGVMCVQFCENNNRLISGSYDKTVHVWNLETGEILKVLTGHTRCVRALQFDDAKLVTGSMDNTLKIWNYNTGHCIRTLQGHTDGVISLHFDSRILVSGSADKNVKVWNFLTGECFTLHGHTDWVNQVKIHRQSMVVSASDDTTIRVWDLNTRTCLKVLEGHVGQVQAAIPSMHGFSHRFVLPKQKPEVKTPEEIEQEQLHSCRQDQQQLQRATSEERQVPIQQQEKEEDDQSNTEVIISGSLDNTLKVWSMETGECLRTLFGHVEGVWSVAFDKRRFVSGSSDSTIRVWDADSGQALHTLKEHDKGVTSVSLSDTKIISASEDGEIRIFDYGMQV